MFLGQIYEPPLQYNYLKRPYTLEPLTLRKMPEVIYLNEKMEEVNASSGSVRYTKYRLKLRDDVRYAPHPAFVKETDGKLKYASVDASQAAKIRSVYDFEILSTRRLKAQDYLYAIKRMAVRRYHSPILDMMLPYIVGLASFSKRVSSEADRYFAQGKRFDLRAYDIDGVEAVDEDTLEITINGRYPQFLYWLSMNFFAPVPWEADLFYQQEALRNRNISLDTSPVGTGPYYLKENDPNRRMVLEKNPCFHTEYYPDLSAQEANASGVSAALLKDAGRKLPFIDRVVYSLEKESIPLWNKFLQGYYDASGVGNEAFDQVVRIGSGGEMGLSDEMRRKGIEMISSVQPSIFYTAFNMVDPVVGGYDERAKKLRQAISIAVDEEEYISIFMNERGVAAQGPIPPGIFGYKEGREGTNFTVYEWREGKRVRKSIEEAKRLLAEAGYPDGVDEKTGKRLKLFFDTTATGPDDRALNDWRRKQFAKLGIELVIRATDYNRFQEKVRTGKVQLFSWGWNADYPDPENFLFLLYGGNAAVKTGGSGINSSNYANAEYDRLFDEIKTMPNSPLRLKKIERMLEIVREEAPWVWGVYPKSLALIHGWYGNVNANAMANNTVKYKRIDPIRRVRMQEAWNKPVLAPLYLSAAGLALIVWSSVRAYRRRRKAVILPEEK